MNNNNVNDNLQEPTRILSLIENLNEINNIYHQILEIEDNHLEIAKITLINFGNTQYSYSYLMKRTFYYSNKYNIKLKIVFRLKSSMNSLFFVSNMYILSGEIECNNYKCNNNYCKDNKHYYKTHSDIVFIVKAESASELMILIENKINDFNICETCSKIWDMNTKQRQENLDEDHSHNCDNCIFTNHLNEKTLESLGDCSICLKKMYCNNSVQTECEHLFHKDCLNTWLVQKNTCPLCRYTIV